MPAGADGGHEESDTVVAGEHSLVVADQFAEALSDVPESENAQTDLAQITHG